MGLFDFLSGDKRAKEKTSAKTAFERACALEGDSRDKRGLRIRQAVRVRAVIDKIFVEGTSAAAGYDEARMMALASGEKIPELPKASVNTCFKTVNTASGPAMAYLPLDHATGVFAVGLAYQTDKIDKMPLSMRCRKLQTRLVINWDLISTQFSRSLHWSFCFKATLILIVQSMTRASNN